MDFKIEAGKFYKTRDGRKVRIYITDCEGEYPIHGAILDKEWFPNRWYKNGGSWFNSPSDIIGTWIGKPIIYWPNLPKYIKFVAIDKSGAAYGFVEKPYIMDDGIDSIWCYFDEKSYLYPHLTIELLPQHYEKYAGDWKDSLVERPKGV